MKYISKSPTINFGSMMKVLTVNHLHPSFKSRFNCENIKEGINNQTCSQNKCYNFWTRFTIISCSKDLDHLLTIQLIDC